MLLWGKKMYQGPSVLTNNFS